MSDNRTRDRFELRLMREAGVPIDECCGYFSISPATAHRWLRELRLKMGPEKIKRRAQYARVHMTALTAQPRNQ